MDDLSKDLDAFYSHQNGVKATTAAGCSLVTFRPLASVALRVRTRQLGEAREEARKKGVPTDYTPDGLPVFTSRDHRKKYMQAYGYFDRDGGYGDAAPRGLGDQYDRESRYED